jgi:hypothetical protein
MLLRGATRIDRQMDAVAETKGERGWHEAPPTSLIACAKNHIESAEVALATLCELDMNEEAQAKYRDRIAHEAADAAAYLLMLVDNASLNRLQDRL